MLHSIRIVIIPVLHFTVGEIKHSSKLRWSCSAVPSLCSEFFYSISSSLLGKRFLELDTQTLKRMEEISTLSADKQNYVYSLIGMTLRDFKRKQLTLYKFTTFLIRL